ncbi:MAG: RagB/SusD family nutrient uptake outer membrane protein [Bacteroidetes bacterium]|nr:RagB/SusD family nutrient uptake outer membrane protein [Bacteroidota bacterium]
MKKYSILIFAGVMLLSGCSKFLDRQPLSQISPSTAFNSENELQLYVNSFYNAMVPNADNDNNGFTSLYNEDADNIVKNAPSVTSNPSSRTVPVSGGGWSWSNLRNINYFLQNYQNGGLPPSITAKYVGVAKFFRAYFYFGMVAHFGDLPWYSTAIAANDSALLHLPRVSRVVIMDSVVRDLDSAIASLPTTKDVASITKYTALALKSRICLFEGTFRKYHTEFSLPDANTFLQKCVDASETLRQSGAFQVYTSTPGSAYRDLFSSYNPVASEIILARQYSNSLSIYHNVNYYTLTASYGKPGLEKKLVNSYLMADGSRFTDKPGYETMQFYSEMQNRDPRLSQTIRTPGYKRIGGTTTMVPSFVGTTTGYQLTKFVTGTVDDAYAKCYNALPVFRYAEVLLNLAEAKAELGTLAQADINNTIKPLRDRVGMPNMDMAAANAQPDAYLAGQYTNVSGANSGVILEIRRERRIELIMEGVRWNDLMRWKEGHLLALQFKGEYFPGLGNYDLDGDGVTDLVIYAASKPSTPGVQFLLLNTDVILEKGVSGGNILISNNITKTFDEKRDYFYPLPTQELLLNPNLKQNPGWQ